MRREVVGAEGCLSFTLNKFESVGEYSKARFPIWSVSNELMTQRTLTFTTGHLVSC